MLTSSRSRAREPLEYWWATTQPLVAVLVAYSRWPTDRLRAVTDFASGHQYTGVGEGEVRPGQGFITRSFGAHPPGRTLTLQWRHTSPLAAWFGTLGEVLRAHYLEINASLPEVAGPPPQIRAVDGPA